MDIGKQIEEIKKQISESRLRKSKSRYHNADIVIGEEEHYEYTEIYTEVH